MRNTKYLDIQEIVSDAIKRYNETSDINAFADDICWYSWPQSWPDTSCGFGGPAGQSFVSAQTLVVEFLFDKEMYVYHDGRYAYHVPVSDRFWRLANSHRLPGVINVDALEKLKDRVP